MATYIFYILGKQMFAGLVAQMDTIFKDEAIMDAWRQGINPFNPSGFYSENQHFMTVHGLHASMGHAFMALFGKGGHKAMYMKLIPEGEF
jgi:hypothetical protein